MKTLATPPERSLIRRPSSGRVTTENASRCYSHTSSAFCGWVACGCAVLVARKMSSLSARSHRTYDGSPNWSSDHHQWVACVLRSVRHMVLKPLLERLQRDRVSCRSSDSRFLQQNLPIAEMRGGARTARHGHSSRLAGRGLYRRVRGDPVHRVQALQQRPLALAPGSPAVRPRVPLGGPPTWRHFVRYWWPDLDLHGDRESMMNIFDAARAGDAATVQACLDAGADVSAVDERGLTPLQ